MIFELYMPTREGIFSYNGKELNLSYFIPMIPYFNPEGGWVMNDAQVVNSISLASSSFWSPRISV